MWILKANWKKSQSWYLFCQACLARIIFTFYVNNSINWLHILCINQPQTKPCSCAIFICHIRMPSPGAREKNKQTFLPFCTINSSLLSLCDYSFAFDPVIISEGGLVIAFLHPVVYGEYIQGTEHSSLFTIMSPQWVTQSHDWFLQCYTASMRSQ